MTEHIIIEGYIQKLSVYNDSFHLISVLTEKEEVKTIVGIPKEKLKEQNYYQFTVVEKPHPKYHKSLTIVDVVEKQPTDRKNILKILQNNLKGVGQKSAEKIYEVFGEETLKILTSDPKSIFSVKLSEKIQNVIFQHFGEINQHNDHLLKLQEFTLSYNEAYDFIIKCKAKEIEDPVTAIKENPYMIRAFLKRVGFLRCDLIAKRIGFPKNHPIRIEECIYHVLRESEQNGDVCMETTALKQRLKFFLSLPIIEIESVIQDIEFTKETEYEYYGEYIYLKRNAVIENIIATKIIKIHESKDLHILDVDKDITLLEEEEKKLNPKFKGLHTFQRAAIIMFFANNLSLLSGGPGTGKTTILKFIIKLCEKYGIKFLLCAPTGMASKRMSVSTNCDAKTIHRTLEYDMSNGRPDFLRDEKNPLEIDALIIDECSMIDMFLFYDLLKAVSVKTKVLLVGDPDQLPPVGPGKVFDDLISCKVFHHVHLTQIYRQGQNSMIIENAYRINNQQPLLLEAPDGYKNDFYFIHMNDSKRVGKYIKELVEYRLHKSHGYDPMNDIQILLPRKKGDLGVLEYNKTLQQVLNKPESHKKELLYKGKWFFREGDKVMQVTNNKDKGVFNGDVGYISLISGNNVFIDFVINNENTTVTYAYDDLEELLLAYSCTVHKSQGSEYKVVIMPVVDEDYMMLYKKLVYTGITRGRELVILVGNYDTLINNLYTQDEKIRNSNLSKKIVLLYNENTQHKIVA